LPDRSTSEWTSVLIGLGQRVFGALLAIAGTVIILTGHWTTSDDMIGDLIAGLIMVAMGLLVLVMWSFQR
jgi:uncharacterized membrane protein YphA (DoxX/SURF4 family)